jgi:hypothetical protein
MKSVIIVLICVIFVRNNLNAKSLTFREWNGIWIGKDDRDREIARIKWEKEIILL